jgi:glutaredoxin
MSRICPHCNYARQATAETPDWQCPSCQKAYAKAGSAPPPETLIQYGPNVEARSGGAGKWLLILLALGLAFWFGRPLLQKGHVVPAMAVASAEQPEVVLYATSWCGYCKMTREFFAANGIRYTEQDIEQSSAALLQHKKLGGKGVPLIVVGDEVINGWNEQSLRHLLGPWLRG